jgi:hypothetical protein
LGVTHGLYVVLVRIQSKRAEIVLVIFGSESGCTVIGSACPERCFVKRGH